MICSIPSRGVEPGQTLRRARPRAAARPVGPAAPRRASAGARGRPVTAALVAAAVAGRGPPRAASGAARPSRQGRSTPSRRRRSPVVWPEPGSRSSCPSPDGADDGQHASAFVGDPAGVQVDPPADGGPQRGHGDLGGEPCSRGTPRSPPGRAAPSYGLAAGSSGATTTARDHWWASRSRVCLVGDGDLDGDAHGAHVQGRHDHRSGSLVTAPLCRPLLRCGHGPEPDRRRTRDP